MKRKTTRKLQFIGNSFMVTLPKGWIDKFGLDKSNELVITNQDDGSLVIIPASVSPEEEKEMVIEFYREIGGEIREKCLSGIERIIITSQQPIEKADMKRIRYFIKNMPTTRIISETPHEIVIQNFGVENLPSREMLHGLFSMTSDLFEVFRESEGDPDNEEVKYKLDQVMEFYMLLMQYIRTYQTFGHLHPRDYQDFDHKKASDYRVICNYIRSIAYKIKALDFFEEGREYYKEIEKYFNDTFDAFITNGTRRVHQRAYGLYFDLLWKKGVDLQEELDGEAGCMIKELVEIYHFISDILSVINIM